MRSPSLKSTTGWPFRVGSAAFHLGDPRTFDMFRSWPDTSGQAVTLSSLASRVKAEASNHMPNPGREFAASVPGVTVFTSPTEVTFAFRTAPDGPTKVEATAVAEGVPVVAKVPAFE